MFEMIITKEQQEKWVEDYIETGHDINEAKGFLDGIVKVMEVLSNNENSLSIK